MATIETSIDAGTDGAVLDTNGHLIRVGPRAELRGVTVVSGGRHGIAVFPSSVSEAVYAVDNRCPHMGFPLHEANVPAAEILAIGGRFGATYRRGGWAAGLTILTAMGNVLPKLHPEDQAIALYHGLVNVAGDCAGQPPRFALDPLPTRDGPLGAERLQGWFRRFIDVRDADGAERALLTAIAADLPPSTLADVLASAATDHFFLDGGHTLDFV